MKRGVLAFLSSTESWLAGSGGGIGRKRLALSLGRSESNAVASLRLAAILGPKAVSANMFVLLSRTVAKKVSNDVRSKSA